MNLRSHGGYIFEIFEELRICPVTRRHVILMVAQSILQGTILDVVLLYLLEKIVRSRQEYSKSLLKL